VSVENILHVRSVAGDTRKFSYDEIEHTKRVLIALQWHTLPTNYSVLRLYNGLTCSSTTGVVLRMVDPLSRYWYRTLVELLGTGYDEKCMNVRVTSCNLL
jgi:hypothetical protein